MARPGSLAWLPTALAIALLGPAPPAAADPPDWTFDPPFGPQRGRIGLQVQSMTPELREHLGAPRDRGVLVVQVEDGRPAAGAGVRVGDVIVEVGAAPIERSWDLMRLVGRAESGTALSLSIVRAGEALELSVEPEGEPSPWADPERWVDRHLRRGSQELRLRLEDLEQRLEELERRLERPAPQAAGGAPSP